MTAEYVITKDDLSAFNLYHHRHSPTARRQYLRSWFSFPVVWLLVCTGIWHLADRARGTPLRTFLDLLPLFSGVPVYLVYFPWAYRRNLKKSGRNSNRTLNCQDNNAVSMFATHCRDIRRHSLTSI